MSVFLTVLGEPASKANSRRIIMRGRKPMSIKSEKALNYADFFNSQVRPIPELMDGELRVDMWIYYASQRPDLDESLILDLLQGKVYINDRQVRERHVYHHIDKANPRTSILVRKRQPGEGLVEERSASSLY